jgi:uncharacterized damage-inducible protein DinB
MTGTINELKHETDRRLDECAGRIEVCLSLVTQEELWQKPGAQLASIGNLVNHLHGNISQWMLKGLGGVPFERRRSAEFEDATGETAAELAAKMRKTIERAREVVAGLTRQDLDRTYTVQGYSETGVGIVLHVVEHLSYHVGQITFWIKLVKDTDVGYYAGKDLDVR